MFFAKFGLAGQFLGRILGGFSIVFNWYGAAIAATVVSFPLMYRNANYSRSFVPQSGASFDGTSFQPEKASQYEVGVKTDFFNGRLSTTLALLVQYFRCRA